METNTARAMFGVPNEVFELTLSHDVMPPHLIKGDRIVIDPKRAPHVGQWALVSWDENCLPVIAKVTKEDNKRYVTSNDWTQEKVPLDSPVEILGTVIQASRVFI